MEPSLCCRESIRSTARGSKHTLKQNTRSRPAVALMCSVGGVRNLCASRPLLVSGACRKIERWISVNESCLLFIWLLFLHENIKSESERDIWHSTWKYRFAIALQRPHPDWKSFYFIIVVIVIFIYSIYCTYILVLFKLLLFFVTLFTLTLLLIFKYMFHC